MKKLYVQPDLGPRDLYPQDLAFGEHRDKARLAFSKFFNNNFGKSFPLYQVYFLNFKGLSIEVFSLYPHKYEVPSVFTFSNSTKDKKGSDFLGIKLSEKEEVISIVSEYKDKTLNLSLHKKTISLKSLEDVSNKNIPLQNFIHEEMGTKANIPSLQGFLCDNFMKNNNIKIFDIKNIEEFILLKSQSYLDQKAA